ncbi:MAG: alginate export family protein, partial [Pseudomonadota bacterium]
ELGSGRLVSVREGPSNRRNFDAARLGLTLPGWQIDGFAGRPVVPAPGVLDDQTSDAQWFWGLYATGRDLVPGGNLDLYYLGFRDDAGAFVQGTQEEERHSLGIRYFGRDAGWDWNAEALYQFGSFGSGDIRAWTVATNSGFTFASVPWSPRLGLSMNVASGDDDPTDRDLGTFNPLFPRGNYFSEAAVLGPRNFFNVNPTVEISPAPGWSAALGSNFFWRLETDDGVYTPSGQILRAPNGSNAQFVGTGLSLSASYDIAANLTATGIYTRLFAGEFLRQTGPGEEIDFFEATLQYKF